MLDLAICLQHDMVDCLVSYNPSQLVFGCERPGGGLRWACERESSEAVKWLSQREKMEQKNEVYGLVWWVWAQGNGGKNNV